MSRTVEQHFDLLKAELALFPDLAAFVSDVNNAAQLKEKLTTDSPVAAHDLILWIQATGNTLTEMSCENTLALVQDVLARRKYGSPGWYVDEAKRFQFGNEVTWTNGAYAYETLNPELRVVKHAAVVPISQGIRLKIATEVGGELAPVDESVMTAIDAYYNDQVIGIKPAGVHLIITTGEADLMKMGLRVVRNPQILSATGASLLNPSVFPVEDAIKRHIQYLSFNGELNLTKLEDSIQNVPGVIDVEIDYAQYKYGTFDYVDIDLAYKPDAGYAKIDPAHPLSGSITYILG